MSKTAREIHELVFIVIEGEGYNFKQSNMRMGKIVSSAEYRMDKQSQNLLIFGISIFFQNEKILKIC